MNSKTGNLLHDTNCLAAEMTRQASVDAARAVFLNGTPDSSGTRQPAYDASLKAAQIAHYRTVKASAILSNLQEVVVECNFALKCLDATP